MSRISKFARLRPSPAAVIAVVALVFAVSGVAVALPGKNTVASKDIKKNAVTAAKIKNGSVTEPKIGDGAVGTSKLGNDAVTGAKVNEATLGKVPSATKADSADTAVKATTAETATKATAATDAAELEGRTLSQVRAIATGVSDDTAQGLDNVNFETVMGSLITLPAGGADVVINASLELDNNSGTQQAATCRLRFAGTLEGTTTFITMPEGGDNQSMSLTAFVDNAGAGVRQTFVECQGSGADDDVRFENGDVAIQAFPIGA